MELDYINTVVSILVVIFTGFNAFLSMKTQLEVTKLKVYMLENFVRLDRDGK